MSKIYAAFSNPKGDLELVNTEFSRLFNFFNSKEIKQKADFSFVLNAKVDELTSAIVAGQKDIRVFLFSGHSGKDGLDFAEADFSSEHLIKFFNAIGADDSKMDCIILNGCENAEIVRRLSNVPVVIGTKSRITDDVAQKFTYDFFSSLIESESTYKQAFVDAIASLDNVSSSIQTRSESGGALPPETHLNEYFLYINREEVAEDKFPMKKGARNWTKYVFLLLLLVAGALGYLFRHPIEQLWRGYSCSLIHNGIDHDKCNFVIGDFTTDQGLNFNEWLFNNVRGSADIRRYLNCINIEKFEKVIKNNSLDRDSLPRICGYDFNMTGSITKDHDQLRAEFTIFPFDPNQLSSSTFVYHVESLGNLDTLITFLDPTLANHFVLFELCASCAVQRGYTNILPAMVALLEEYTFDARTAPSYQRLQQRLSDAALEVGDTTMALKALDQVAMAKENDFALWALEEKVKIYSVQKDVSSQYLAQTDYLQAIERRSQITTVEPNGTPQETYVKASKQIRLDRADLVTKNDEVLRDKQPEAIKDYEKLDRAKFKDRNYQEEIKVLKKKQASNFNAGLAHDLSATHGGFSAIDEKETLVVHKADGLKNESAILQQPALMDAGAINKFNAGFVKENNTIEQLHVAVVTTPKEEKIVKRITKRLSEFGYLVDEKLSGLTISEDNHLLDEPTVIYNHPDMKVKAYYLARMLSEAYSKEFQVIPATQLASQKVFIRKFVDLDMVVYWE